MKLPKTYKGFAKLLIQIAEHGNDFDDPKILTQHDRLNFGEVIADIQNWCGSNEETLKKLKIEYH